MRHEQVQSGLDLPRINVYSLHELHDWAERLRITADGLREVVRRVGDRADDVERYLKTANR